MATIFNIVGERHAFTFQPKRAAIYGYPNVSLINATESFTVQFSSGAAITLNTLGDPYADLSALKTDWQTQINSAIGSGIGSVVNINETCLAFADVANISVQVSNISVAEFTSLRFPNISRNTTVAASTAVPQGQYSLSAFSPYNFAIDIISDMYEIPSGANSISFYYQVNEVVSDGYSQPAQMYIFWTNGVDGYITNGLYTELQFATVNRYSDAEFGSTQIDSPLGIKNLTPLIYALGFANNSNGLTEIARGATAPIDIPIGATGCYVGIILFGNDYLVPNPPAVTIAAIAGTG